MNECLDGRRGGCQQVCVDTFDSYYCACEKGYKITNNFFDCRGRQYCRYASEVKTTLCYCYERDDCDIRLLNGTFCANYDECRGEHGERNGGCHHICTDTEGSYRCSCRQGWTLARDQHQCIDVDECESRPCSSEQLCVNTYGSHYCLSRQRSNALVGDDPAFGGKTVKGLVSKSKLTMAAVMSAVGAMLMVAIAMLTIRQVTRWRARKSRAKDCSGVENQKDSSPNVKCLLDLPNGVHKTEGSS